MVNTRFLNYQKWSILYYFDAVGKIKPVLDYEIKVKNEIHFISMFTSLFCMFDVGLTLTEDSTVFEEFYFRQLPEVNPNVGKNLHVMKEIIREVG
ncbi:MAG: hypothetical protein QXQ77_02650 [Candidatus Aenigmatarchaeota archaeon]